MNDFGTESSFPLQCISDNTEYPIVFLNSKSVSLISQDLPHQRASWRFSHGRQAGMSRDESANSLMPMWYVRIPTRRSVGSVEGLIHGIGN